MCIGQRNLLYTALGKNTTTYIKLISSAVNSFQINVPKEIRQIQMDLGLT